VHREDSFSKSSKEKENPSPHIVKKIVANAFISKLKEKQQRKGSDMSRSNSNKRSTSKNTKSKFRKMSSSLQRRKGFLSSHKFQTRGNGK